MSHSVIVDNATKKYKMYRKNTEKLLDLVLPTGYGEDFFAVQNISFTASKGDVIGVVGVNGAGKSTLANLIAGVIPPTKGKVETKGTASLIAISSGLNGNLTGRENIELKCLMLGFNKAEINELMPEIIDFADIGKFIDQPVKNYSSGMKSRLGFAISVNMDPDILVIDEALSVGDQTFADKCLDKMNEFKERGKTIFFISHSIGQVRKFCQKALWLEAGEVKAYGTVDEVLPQYEKFIKEFKAMSKADQKNFKQLVLEKRSKLRQQEGDWEEYDELETRNSSKRISFKLVKWFVLRMLLFIAFFVVVFIFWTSDKYGSTNNDNANNDALINSSPNQNVNVATEDEPKNNSELTFSSLKQSISNLPDSIQQVFKESYVDGNKVQIIVVGSPSIGAGVDGWSVRFKEEIEAFYGNDFVKVEVIEYDGTSTEFINDELASTVANKKADIVLLEGFTLKDNSGLVSTETSIENITQFIDMLKGANPEVKIIIQPPNPIHGAVNYPRQVAELQAFSEENGLPYFNHWEDWPDSNSSSITDYLNDESLPNKKGHQLWADSILDWFIASEKK